MGVLNSGTSIKNSSIVGSQHFGLNYLVHLDGGSEEQIVFEDIVNDLHKTGSIRFPGGTVAEIGVQRVDENGNIYYVEPPLDISISNGNLANSTLSFLESAAQNNWNVTFVLPMWRFLNENTMATEENASSEISTYVSAVISEASRLGVTIDGFELGNEWDILTYRTSEGDGLTRAEAAESSLAYAAFAAELAVAIQVEISAAENSRGVNVYNEETEPFIAIQTLWAWMGNSSGYAEDFESAIRTAFPIGSEAQDAVDTVLSHFYLWQAGGGAEVNDPSTAYFLRNMEDISAIFRDGLDYLISEWNLQMTVNGGAQPNANSGDGIQQLEPIVGLFHTMISEGVDYANFWAVRQSSWNSLYGTGIDNGMPQSDRPVRYIFDLLSDQLVGTAAIDLNGAADGSMKDIGDNIHVYGFENANSSILYFGSRSDTGQSIDLDLVNYGTSPETTLVQITRISVDDPTLASHLQETTIVTDEYTFTQFQALTGKFLNFSPYELISIEIIYNVEIGERESGTAIKDMMFGTAASDIFIGSAGADEIYGYFGTDTADYFESATSVNVFLNAYHGLNNSGDADGDKLSSIENVSGSYHDDIISGDNDVNVLIGRAGNDFLRGRFGDDILVGGPGNDLLDGGQGNDTVEFDVNVADVIVENLSDGTVRIISDLGRDLVKNIETFTFLDDVLDLETLRSLDTNSIRNYNLDGFSKLTGTVKNDLLEGGTGNDVITGGYGDDTLIGGAGNDLLDGGAGNDTVNYASSSEAVAIFINTYFGTNHGGDSQGDTFISIESIIASSLDDILSGDGENNTLVGSAGNDKLYGRYGNDVLDGGAGSDRLEGGNNNDIMMGGRGKDFLLGGAGSDYLGGGGGRDKLFGGNGKDIMKGGAGSDRLDGQKGDDNLQGGSGRDQLYGGSGSDILVGGAGADILNGGKGGDTLVGGGANDKLRGGDGADTFVFDQAGIGNDVIRDLCLAEGDILELNSDLWVANLTEAQVVDKFAQINSAGHVVLVFDEAQSITMEGLGSIANLEDGLFVL